MQKFIVFLSIIFLCNVSYAQKATVEIQKERKKSFNDILESRKKFSPPKNNMPIVKLNNNYRIVDTLANGDKVAIGNLDNMPILLLKPRTKAKMPGTSNNRVKKVPDNKNSK